MKIFKKATVKKDFVMKEGVDVLRPHSGGMKKFKKPEKYNIQIVNFKTEKYGELYDVNIDRRTPVGSPFNIPKDGPDKIDFRYLVCEKYKTWFQERLVSPYDYGDPFLEYLELMLKIYRKHKKLRLFCWCSPKQCHGETIKRHIIKTLEKEKNK